MVILFLSKFFYYYPRNPPPFHYPQHFGHPQQLKKISNPINKSQLSMPKVEEKQDSKKSTYIDVKKEEVSNEIEEKGQGPSPTAKEIEKINQSDKKKRKKKRSFKDDYIPYTSQRKKQKKLTQNIFRNVLPNVVHQIFSFIQKKNRSGNLVERMLEHFPQAQTASLNKFYLYQNLIKGKINNYINQKSLKQLRQLHQPKCEIYSREEQELFLRMSRVLAKHFLQNQFNSIVLTSTRMKRESRLNHFEIKRTIKSKLNQIMNEEKCK